MFELVGAARRLQWVLVLSSGVLHFCGSLRVTIHDWDKSLTSTAPPPGPPGFKGDKQLTVQNLIRSLSLSPDAWPPCQPVTSNVTPGKLVAYLYTQFMHLSSADNTHLPYHLDIMRLKCILMTVCTRVCVWESVRMRARVCLPHSKSYLDLNVILWWLEQ